MLSLLFIRRPKTAAVISIALFQSGALSAFAISDFSEYLSVTIEYALVPSTSTVPAASLMVTVLPEVSSIVPSL